MALAPVHAALPSPAAKKAIAQQVDEPCHNAGSSKAPTGKSSKSDCCASGDCSGKCANQCPKPIAMSFLFGHIERRCCPSEQLADSFDSPSLPLPERPPRLI